MAFWEDLFKELMAPLYSLADRNIVCLFQHMRKIKAVLNYVGFGKEHSQSLKVKFVPCSPYS